MKILRKPKIAVTIVIVTDILALILAAVLNMLRGLVPAEYHFDDIHVLVEVSHPYELFGLFTAVALVAAAALSGVMIAAAVIGGKEKATPRIVGAVLLLIISVAAILFSHVFVCGLPVKNIQCFLFEDTNGDRVAVQERQYTENSGVLEIFSVDAIEHEHHEGEEHDHYSVAYLTSTPITEFSKNDDRYTLDWVGNDLRIRYYDGAVHRTLQIKRN